MTKKVAGGYKVLSENPHWCALKLLLLPAHCYNGNAEAATEPDASRNRARYTHIVTAQHRSEEHAWPDTAASTSSTLTRNSTTKRSSFARPPANSSRMKLSPSSKSTAGKGHSPATSCRSSANSDSSEPTCRATAASACPTSRTASSPRNCSAATPACAVSCPCRAHW